MMKLPHCALTCALVAVGRHRSFDSKTGNSKGLYPKLMAKENRVAPYRWRKMHYD